MAEAHFLKKRQSIPVKRFESDDFLIKSSKSRTKLRHEVLSQIHSSILFSEACEVVRGSLPHSRMRVMMLKFSYRVNT